MTTYYCLYTYPGQTVVHVLHGADDKVIIGNDDEGCSLLQKMAEKLQDENLINNFRIVKEI